MSSRRDLVRAPDRRAHASAAGVATVRAEGVGLHGGRPSAVTLSRAPGPTTLGRGLDRAPIASLGVAASDRTVSATLPSGASVRSVEHLLAAIAGAGAFDGLRVDVEGDEVPLLDGCSAWFFDAIRALGVGRCARAARVVRSSRIEAAGATMIVEPGPSIEIEVEVDFPAERFGRALRGVARWTGDPDVFREVVAPSRTFGAARELDALRARGLAAHVPAGIVLALDLEDEDRAPRDPHEPIRHKLLDAIGDLASLGAPLHGYVRIERPSHLGTTEALAIALGTGAIARPSTARDG